MKIFISWSGNRSNLVAVFLKKWVKRVLQAAEPWHSSKDIDRGSIWFNEITQQLAITDNGIICLTKDNLNQPWILFESGALAKGLTNNRIYTFLIDISPADVKDPLAQFNHTLPEKESMFQMIKSINKNLDELMLDDETLTDVFNTYWPQFEEEFEKIIKETELSDSENNKNVRSTDDKVEEILYSVRNLDKRFTSIIRQNYGTINKLNNPYENPYKQIHTLTSDLDISLRTYNILKSNGIEDIEDIVKLGQGGLSDIFGENKKELGELISHLNNMGISWIL